MTNQTVVIAVGSTRNHVYHTDLSCTNLPENSKTTNREDVEERGFSECRVCKHGFCPNREQSTGLRQLIESGRIDV